MSHDVINFFAWLRSFLCLKQSGYACMLNGMSATAVEHQHDENPRKEGKLVF